MTTNRNDRNENRPHVTIPSNAAAFLQQMIALESLEQSGVCTVNIGTTKKQKLVPASEVNVEAASHTLGTHQGDDTLSWGEYLNAIVRGIRFQFELNGLPRMRKDPVGRFTAINQAMVEHNGELCFPIVPEHGVFIRLADVVVDADTQNLVSRWNKVIKDADGVTRIRRTWTLSGDDPKYSHSDRLRQAIVAKVSDQLRAHQDEPAELLATILERCELTESGIMFRFCDGFSKPIEQVTCSESVVLRLDGDSNLRRIATRIKLFTLGLPEDPELRLSVMAAMEINEGKNLDLGDGFTVPTDWVAFRSVDGVYVAGLRGNIGWDDHKSWLAGRLSDKQTRPTRKPARKPVVIPQKLDHKEGQRPSYGGPMHPSGKRHPGKTAKNKAKNAIKAREAEEARKVTAAEKKAKKAAEGDKKSNAELKKAAKHAGARA